MAEPANSERALVRAVREAAKELGIRAETFSQDWIIRLEGAGRTRYVFGYNFDLNGASGHLIANDKSAASELLGRAGIPAVEHRLFLRPNLAGYVSGEGNWREMLSYFEEKGRDVVCKSNTGTGGNQVYRARTPLDLERSVQKLFSSNRAVALSPFVNIGAEYRLVMLEGTCELAYEKVRPSVLGDGRSTLLELFLRDYPAGRMSEAVLDYLSGEGRDSLSTVPGQGERVVLTWKHNLGRGARAVELGEGELKRALAETAASCMRALNLRFASVDLIRGDGLLSVMEVNAGVMMETYSRQGEAEYEKTKGIYMKAVLRMMS